jgi:VWFA-related protein
MISVRNQIRHLTGLLRSSMLLTLLVLPMLSQVPGNTVMLHSSTRLVQLSVIANDKSGHPLTDLVRDGFEVYDQGKLQQIRIFTKESMPSEAAPERKPADGNSLGRTFTNMAEARSGPGAVTIILIDSLNTKWVNQAYARQQIIKFLSQIRPDDHIAIYSMGFGGFRVLHDFTQDASGLVSELASWKGEAKAQALPEDSSAQPDMGRQLGQWLKGTSPDFIQSQLMGDSDRFGPVQSLRILTAIANQLAGIPGRKNLIWISEGFPLIDWSSLVDVAYGAEATEQMSRTPGAPPPGFGMADPGSFHDEMAAAMRVISDNNVAVYPVDALCLFEPFATADGKSSATAGMKALAGIHARQNAMDDIAKRTGGKAFYESNDLKGAIRMAMDDSKTTYTLGFYPDSVQLNGKFHSLKVRVVGRSDVRLRYRLGYIDSPEPAKRDSDRRIRLERAAWSPLDANGIALSAKIEPVDSSDGIHRNRLLLKINASDLSFQRGSERAAEADILFEQKDERGRQLDVVEQLLRVTVDSNHYEEILRTGITFNRDFTLNPNTSSLRVVVGDAGTDRLGSISIPHAGLLP